MANSHWGKFGEKSVRTQLTYYTEARPYIQKMTDNSVEVQDLIPVNDYHIAVRWKVKEDFDVGLNNVNVVLAAYTTAQARLKLYGLLEKLQERVLYFDTDSVVYIRRPGLWDPPLGDYLGELKDETKGVPIQCFVSGGPKNYAYELTDGETVNKIRGFRLDYRSSLSLNFYVMREMIVQGEQTKAIETIDPYRLVRTANGAMFTKEYKKVYRMVYSKRVIAEDRINTLPYGWKHG